MFLIFGYNSWDSIILSLLTVAVVVITTNIYKRFRSMLIEYYDRRVRRENQEGTMSQLDEETRRFFEKEEETTTRSSYGDENETKKSC